VTEVVVVTSPGTPSKRGTKVRKPLQRGTIMKQSEKGFTIERKNDADKKCSEHNLFSNSFNAC